MERAMAITRAAARQTSLFYLMMGLPGPLVLLYLPRAFVVHGDAAATAQRIASNVATYRWLALADLVSPIGFVLLAWSLFNLFEDVDRKQARLLVSFVAVAATLGLVDAALLLVPVVLQSGSSYLAAFTKSQLDALTLGAFAVRDLLLLVNQAFWGLWLLPFGILVIKSGFAPKVIGFFLIIGCVGWLVLCATGIVFPVSLYPGVAVVNRFAFMMVQPGEVLVLLWFIFKGVTLKPIETGLAYAN
jgi:hypothetical protein